MYSRDQTCILPTELQASKRSASSPSAFSWKSQIPTKIRISSGGAHPSPLTVQADQISNQVPRLVKERRSVSIAMSLGLKSMIHPTTTVLEEIISPNQKGKITKIFNTPKDNKMPGQFQNSLVKNPIPPSFPTADKYFASLYSLLQPVGTQPQTIAPRRAAAAWP